MAKIEMVSGILRSVDTDNNQLVLAIQVVPPEPQTEDHGYSFDLPDMDEERWLVFVGTGVECTVSDNVVKKIT